MKTAIYIEDGIVQLVITPENEFEKNALRSFEHKSLQVKIFSGSFYDCRGGWIRQKEHLTPMQGLSYTSDNEDRSLILRIDESTSDSRQSTITE